MRFLIRAAAMCHIGKVRKNNEDNYCLCGQYRRDVTKPRGSYEFCGSPVNFSALVADGMGGLGCGETASLLAVQQFCDYPFAVSKEHTEARIRLANDLLCQKMTETGERMGSTLAGFFCSGQEALCFNIGDSRIYRLHGGQLSRISVDDNRAQSMVNAGFLTAEEAETHRARHELTQHLGIFEREMVIEPHFADPLPLCAGDVYLLCSDGLTDMVKDDAIEALLNEKKPPLKTALALTDAALEGGGRDNITVLVISVEEDNRTLLERLLGTDRA